MMRRLFLGALGALAMIGVSAAQVGQLGPGEVIGNSSAAQAPPSPSTVNALLNRALGTTADRILCNLAGTWQSCSAPVVSGLTVSGTATIGTASVASAQFRGSGSGVVTVAPAAAAGTWQLTLPTDDGTVGQFLRTDGNGVTSWVSQTAYVSSVTCNDGLTVITGIGTCPSREVLTANRTYYIRADGNDTTCSGLVDAAAASAPNCAFLTKQKAADVTATKDIRSFTVTWQMRTGTYAGTLAITQCWLGTGSVFLVGDTVTPANVQISGAGNMISVTAPCKLVLGGGYAITSSAGNLIYAEGAGAYIHITGPIQLHTTPNVQIYASRCGRIMVVGQITISGAGDNYVQSSHCGSIRFDNSGNTTFIANVAYPNGLVYANFGDLVWTGTATFVNLTGCGGAPCTITGVRWRAYGGMIQASGQAPPNPTFFPGSLSGQNYIPDFGGQVIRPAQLTANTNDWSPTGLSNARYIFVSTDASRDLTGIDAQYFNTGQRITLVNVGTQNLVLKHNNAGSAVANRFFLTGAADVTVPTFGSTTVIYDRFNAFWRMAL